MAHIASLTPSTPCAYTGAPGPLTRRWLKNTLRGLLTLGIYYVHGRQHTRTYQWHHVHAGNEPLSWHGTAKDQKRVLSAAARWLVLLSLARVLLVLCRPSQVLSAWLDVLLPGHTLLSGAIWLATAPLFTFFHRQYELRYTAWRGIRFGHDGTLSAYARVYFRYALLNLATLGLAYGHFAIQTRRYLVGHTTYGTVRARYTGEPEAAGRLYVLGTLASVLSLGAYLPWHIAKLRNYHAQQTTLGPLRLRSSQEGASLSNLWVMNAIIYIGTLGFGHAWARTRAMRYQMAHLHIEGDLQMFRAEHAPLHAGEGLADLLSFAGDDLLGA